MTKRVRVWLLVGLMLDRGCEGMYATTGCHPTRSKEFESFGGGPEAYLAALDKLIEQTNKSRSGASTATAGGPGRVVAYGECGLGAARRVDSPELLS